jgi:hypothetical protein
MQFEILLGEPDVAEYWSKLDRLYDSGKLSGKEKTHFHKIVKAFRLLASNPRSNSLATHEIQKLTKKYHYKVFQSYLENKVPAAGRIFWAYGPSKGQITILAIESHPEMKSKSYARIKLSTFPPGKKK